MKTNMGIIGLGWMGTQHLKTISQDTGIDVIAAYDTDPERVRYAESCGLRPYSDLAAFLNDPAIELVMVAAPNNTHKELGVAALKAGKNVICEKPAAMNSRELEELMEAAKESGKLLTVHHNRRWDRDFATVKKILEDGTVEQPFFIESRVQGANGIPGAWRAQKEAGGGMVYDWGVHLVDQLLFLFPQRVKSVHAHLMSVKYPEVDDNFKALIQFEDGPSALIEVDTACFHPLPRWHVLSANGSIAIDDFACNGGIVRGKVMELLWKPNVPYGTLAGPTRTMAPRPEDSLERLPLPKVESDVMDYFRNVKAVLDGKAKLIVKPEECLRVMKVIDAIFLSAQSGESVNCSI